MPTETEARPAEAEVKQLRTCINNLIGVVALPAVWNGMPPSEIVRTLLDALLGMLQLDFVYLRMQDATGEIPLESVRVDHSRAVAVEPEAIGELLKDWRGRPQTGPRLVKNPSAEGDLSIVSLPLGLGGEVGVLVAGSRRADFPAQTERLLLSVAANQAIIGLQEAWRLSEQKRAADELDQRVVRGTKELAAANEYLQKEIAERQVSEAAVGKLRSELAHVARVTTLGALTASIAHEVNQPLSGIVTNASTCLRMLAADPPNVDGARETARRTIRDANRASEMITRLRALFSKKGSSTESVDLNEAIREVLARLSGELQRVEVVVQAELADDLPLVSGDRVQLQQVVRNLILNARDAMVGVKERARQLRIRTDRETGDFVRVTVEDTGVGFETQDVDRVFEAFYTTKADGMGIGLSVSRSIIESHHGRMWAAANDGPGATFAFAIPSATQAMTRQEERR